MQRKSSALEDYAVAGQRREDREGLAYLCKELSGSMHMVTAPGIAELWRVLYAHTQRPLLLALCALLADSTEIHQ